MIDLSFWPTPDNLQKAGWANWKVLMKKRKKLPNKKDKKSNIYQRPKTKSQNHQAKVKNQRPKSMPKQKKLAMTKLSWACLNWVFKLVIISLCNYLVTVDFKDNKNSTFLIYMLLELRNLEMRYFFWSWRLFHTQKSA